MFTLLAKKKNRVVPRSKARTNKIVRKRTYLASLECLKMQPYSRSGGTRKCFYEFQTLVACYTSADTVAKKECTPVFDDYFECLHGYKEREKARLMFQQLKANEASGEGVKASDLFKNSGSVYENLDLVK